MAYKDRFGRTDICDGQYNNLLISWDYDSDPENEKERYPVLLFTPNVAADEHHHIRLNPDEAKELHRWLSDYLENKKTRWKK